MNFRRHAIVLLATLGCVAPSERDPVDAASTAPQAQAAALLAEMNADLLERRIARGTRRITGRLVDSSGHPVERFTLDDRPWGPDARGRFEWERGSDLPDAVELRGDGFATQAVALRSIALGPPVDADLGEIVVTPGRELRGRVVDARTKAPVIGAWISTVPQGPRQRPLGGCGNAVDYFRAHFTPALTTDVDGRFVLFVRDEPTTLYVGSAAHTSRATPIPAGLRAVRIALEGAGNRIVGRVFHEDGRRWPGLAVSASGAVSRTVRTRADGSFVLDGLGFGAHLVWVEAPKGIPRESWAFESTTVTLREGERALDFRERGTAQLEFRLPRDWDQATIVVREGDVAFPPRAQEFAVESVIRGDHPRTFKRLPLGPHTAFVARSLAGGISVVRVPVTLARGEVRVVTPDLSHPEFLRFAASSEGPSLDR